MNGNFDISWSELDQIIADARSILLTTHINPDGDGIGSEVAFFHHLQELKKEVRVINVSPVPYQYEFLNNGKFIEQYCEDHDDWIRSCDIAIIFDVGDPGRIHEIGDLVYGNVITVCIDHHSASSLDAYTHTIIDPEAPSTGSLIWEYLKHCNGGELLPLPVANALYTAIVTDTGSFKYNNTNAHAHAMAIHMIESGISPHKIHQEIFERRKLKQVKLLGEVIQGLNFEHNNQTVHFRITKPMLDSIGATQEDVDGYTDFVRSIDGVEIAFMLMEMNELIRINFRSKGHYTVNDIAKVFGGGGHKFAAGATVLNGNIPEIEQQLLGLIGAKLNGETA